MKRRIFIIAGVVVVVLAGLFIYFMTGGYQKGLYPEVWSQKSPEGESYEFKVNCFGIYTELETCYLWDLDAVTVTAPDGTVYELEKDFNINEYSGEVTRRWVLYGPIGAGLPETGEYLFTYIKDGDVVYTQTVDYEQSRISYPTGVTWRREGNDLHVTWVPPENVDSSMWYKVIVSSDVDTPELFISDIFDWDASAATLEDVPLLDGGTYILNVPIFYPDGYAYGYDIFFTW